VDFTREPIIETIITPKEGCKLVVRSSKNTGQEEYFVDAVEVVTFGQTSFFRSLERPKPFLVPVSDYELLEVREARMVLKSVGIDRSIKIGGGRESPRAPRTNEKENHVETPPPAKQEAAPLTEASSTEVSTEERPAAVEKKKDRRRQYRKRRGGQLAEKIEGSEIGSEQTENDEVIMPAHENEVEAAQQPATLPSFSSLLQPPPTLISETIGRYRENALFKSAFFLDEEDQYKPHDKVQELLEDDENTEEGDHSLQKPTFAEGVSEEIDAECQSTCDVKNQFFEQQAITSELSQDAENFNEPQTVIELPQYLPEQEFESEHAEPEQDNSHVEQHQDMHHFVEHSPEEPSQHTSTSQATIQHHYYDHMSAADFFAEQEKNHENEISENLHVEEKELNSENYESTNKPDAEKNHVENEQNNSHENHPKLVENEDNHSEHEKQDEENKH